MCKCVCQKKVLDLVKLELQMVVSWAMWHVSWKLNSRPQEQWTFFTFVSSLQTHFLTNFDLKSIFWYMRIEQWPHPFLLLFVWNAFFHSLTLTFLPPFTRSIHSSASTLLILKPQKKLLNIQLQWLQHPPWQRSRNRFRICRMTSTVEEVTWVSVVTEQKKIINQCIYQTHRWKHQVRG